MRPHEVGPVVVARGPRGVGVVVGAPVAVANRLRPILLLGGPSQGGEEEEEEEEEERRRESPLPPPHGDACRESKPVEKGREENADKFLRHHFKASVGTRVLWCLP